MKREKEQWEIELEKKEREMHLEKFKQLQGKCSGFVFIYGREEELISSFRFKNQFLEIKRMEDKVGNRPFYLVVIGDFYLYIYDEDKIRVDEYNIVRIGEPLKFIVDLD